jgi:hypothetical protein
MSKYNQTLTVLAPYPTLVKDSKLQIDLEPAKLQNTEVFHM